MTAPNPLVPLQITAASLGSDQIAFHALKGEIGAAQAAHNMTLANSLESEYATISTQSHDLVIQGDAQIVALEHVGLIGTAEGQILFGQIHDLGILS